MENRRNKIYFFYKQTDESAKKMEKLQKLTIENGFEIVEDAAKANIIAAVGGDGAFLQAVRSTHFRDDCLYVGIAVRALGFYCDFHIDDHRQMLEAVNYKVIEVRKYPYLQVTLEDGSSFYCLNECTIRTSLVKVFSLEVYIDDLYFETFKGDGMVISTPTGSSGYNKSLGGAIIDPKIPCFQISESASINNNFYRTLGSSFIVSGDHKILLRIKDNEPNYPTVSLDNEALNIRSNKTFGFSLPDKRIKTVKLKHNSFWEKVQRSFL